MAKAERSTSMMRATCEMALFLLSPKNDQSILLTSDMIATLFLERGVLADVDG